MASSSIPATSRKWTQLSPSVFLSEPVTSDGATTRSLGFPDGQPTQTSSVSARTASRSFSAPKLIILFTWMAAQASHINKYIQGYQTRYPTSRILTIRSAAPDLFHRRARAQRIRVAPAVSTILSTISAATTGSKEDPESPQIILHIFSNGGSHQARNFLLAYREATGMPLSPYVTIFDSCPGRATFTRSVLALSSSVPPSLPLPVSFLLMLLVYLLLGICWVIFVPLNIANPIERARQALNSRAVMEGECRRCYLYSEVDPMVGWQDVEDHAREAGEVGFAVRLEKFEGSGHCAHVRVGGGERYWRIVEDLFRASPIVPNADICATTTTGSNR